MRALLLDYRLAPEHPYPAAVNDSVAAYWWLLYNGIHPRNIVVAGDASGGGLAVATLLSLRDAGDPPPAAAICITPWTDLAGTGDSLKTRVKVDPCLTPQSLSCGHSYAGLHDPCLPLISPLYADLRGLPPLLIQAADDHILLSDATRLAQQAKEAGVPVTLEVWQGMWHVFHRHAPHLPEARSAIGAIGAFARRHLGESAARNLCG